MRAADEWFNDPDEVDLVEGVLTDVDKVTDWPIFWSGAASGMEVESDTLSLLVSRR